MKHAYSFVLLLMMIFVRACDGRLLYSGILTNFSSEIPDVTEDILRASEISQGSVAFIIDGNSNYEMFQRFSQKLAGNFSLGVFEVSSELPGDGNSNLNQVMQQLKEISDKTNELTIIMAVDGSDDYIKVLLEKLLEYELLMRKTKLIFFTGSKGNSYFQVREIFANANAIIVYCSTHPKFQRCSITAYLPYSLKEIFLAFWTINKRLSDQTHHTFFPPKFDRLIDRGHLYVTGEDYTPFVEVELIQDAEDEEKQNFTFHGPMMEVLRIISSSMNFTFTLRRPPDGSWGYVLPNGSATGMTGQIARKEADIFLGPLSMTLNRKQVMDFTVPVRFNSLGVLARVGASEVDSWAFVMPLSPSVWLALVISLLIVILSAAVLSMIDGDGLHNTPFVYITLILQQAVTIPNEWWKRWLISGWAVVTTIIVLSYKGNLITPLAIRYITRNIRSLSDVLDDTSITMMWEANTAHVRDFRAAKSGELLRLQEAEEEGRVRFIYGYEDHHDLLESLVMRGDHVLFLGEMSLQMLLASEFTITGKCNYYVTGGIYKPRTDVLGTQRHSPILPGLNKRLSILQESGIFRQLIQNAIRNSSTCYKASSTKVVQSSFSLKNVWGIFMILVVGDAISLLVLSLEAIKDRIHYFYLCSGLTSVS